MSYSLNLAQFSLLEDSVINPIRFTITLNLLDMRGDTLEQICEQKSIKPDSAVNPQNSGVFIDLKRFTIKADTITLHLNIANSARNLSGNVKKKFAVKKYTKALSISDLFFASHVQKSSDKSSFEKHGLIAIPNPLRVFTFGEQTQNIYIYFEINNLEYNSNTPSSYSVNYTISDLTGREITSHNRPAIVKTNTNCARFEIIPLKDLKHGLYLLKMNVTDLLTGNNCSTSRYFEVYEETESNKMFLSMTDEDIKKYYDQIKYIATNEEKEIFRTLDARGKQAFLLNFWSSRDTDPETDENEFMTEHFRRLQYSENKFNGGINSDMGRVLIQYGPPIDIQRQFSTSHINRPVEIWYYALEGKTEFIFVDRSGDGHYVLVHSNHPDEYQNPNWMEVMK
ncbi:GWxTD domain-containing protein [candidate division KSB1 bacterium]|nr:GWxTD domain-containing protein [candidate division KSB1 bacterium]